MHGHQQQPSPASPNPPVPSHWQIMLYVVCNNWDVFIFSLHKCRKLPENSCADKYSFHVTISIYSKYHKAHLCCEIESFQVKKYAADIKFPFVWQKFHFSERKFPGDFSKFYFIFASKYIATLLILLHLFMFFSHLIFPSRNLGYSCVWIMSEIGGSFC